MASLQSNTSRYVSRSTFKPFTSAAVTARRPSRRSSSMQVKAVLAAEVAAAVTQQATAFAVVLGAEAAFSRFNVPDADQGRPQIVPVAAGVGGTLAAALLIGNGGGLIPTIGAVLGLAASGAMIYYNARRTIDLQYNDGDWPGPKAWPAGMCLISFFAFAAFFQAVVQDVTTPVL
eukprot:GHUV01006916.1.p1 GENE.GHUV01006916.1~~GHUV01006916.1.p1  ORF type:complete len:175 (+),score=66.50 GHUV01006916.1:210-734(+)